MIKCESKFENHFMMLLNKKFRETMPSMRERFHSTHKRTEKDSTIYIHAEEFEYIADEKDLSRQGKILADKLINYKLAWKQNGKTVVNSVIISASYDNGRFAVTFNPHLYLIDDSDICEYALYDSRIG